MISSRRRRLPVLALLFLVACGQGEPVSIVWTEEKATGLIIRRLVASESDLSGIQVRLENRFSPVLGRCTLSGDEVIFTPIVPLSRGSTYELLEDDIVFGKITIPQSEGPAPKIIGVYPNVKTVPANLLKVHIFFSRQMVEGKSAQFIKLIENGKDTLDGTFLDLQPELWDGNNEVLTLWLDPGRIKLDLIPNQKLGNPLKLGALYELAVLPGWKAKNGLAVQTTFSRSFVVGARDDQSPSLENWKLEIPASKTRDPLIINFNEPLDRLLALDCIQVIDHDSTRVAGSITVEDNVMAIWCRPLAPWKPGTYSILVESRLEDLAGNNLNRLFEVDLTKPGAKSKGERSFGRSFEVK